MANAVQRESSGRGSMIRGLTTVTARVFAGRLLAVVASVLVVFGTLDLQAETLALYTCEDGVAGQDVTTLKNVINPGTYDGIAYANEITGGRSTWRHAVLHEQFFG